MVGREKSWREGGRKYGCKEGTEGNKIMEERQRGRGKEEDERRKGK